MLFDFLSLIAVAALWGGTNPLMKKGSAGIENIKSDSSAGQFFLEMKYLITNWKYLIPFLLNTFGSVLYFLTLQNTELSLAVPVANSLTFVFTALVGRLLGEQPASKNMYLGIILVIAGSSMWFADKLKRNEVSLQDTP